MDSSNLPLCFDSGCSVLVYRLGAEKNTLVIINELHICLSGLPRDNLGV